MSSWIYILVAALVTYLIRVLPLTLIKKPIENIFIKSFLYYVPYITLAVMTFPAIVSATGDAVSGYVALGVGIIAAWYGLKMFQVAGLCCLAVFVTQLII